MAYPFAGYSNPGERIALVIGAVVMLALSILAATLSRGPRSSAEPGMTILAVFALGICILLFVIAFAAP
jgi:hypothetical protein